MEVFVCASVLHHDVHTLSHPTHPHTQRSLSPNTPTPSNAHTQTNRPSKPPSGTPPPPPPPATSAFGSRPSCGRRVSYICIYRYVCRLCTCTYMCVLMYVYASVWIHVCAVYICTHTYLCLGEGEGATSERLWLSTKLRQARSGYTYMCMLKEHAAVGGGGRDGSCSDRFFRIHSHSCTCAHTRTDLQQAKALVGQGRMQEAAPVIAELHRSCQKGVRTLLYIHTYTERERQRQTCTLHDSLITITPITSPTPQSRHIHTPLHTTIGRLGRRGQGDLPHGGLCARDPVLHPHAQHGPHEGDSAGCG